MLKAPPEVTAPSGASHSNLAEAWHRAHGEVGELDATNSVRNLSYRFGFEQSGVCATESRRCALARANNIVYSSSSHPSW
jgi:hypothetical protein